MFGIEKYPEGLRMGRIKIAAVGDVHSPRFLTDFTIALSKCKTPDIFLFAGDMISRGKEEEYINILNAIDSQLGSEFPILSCFGNEDPVGMKNKLCLVTRDRLTFLDEKSVILSIGGSQVSVVGISAVSSELLDVRSKDVDKIRIAFEERASRLSSLLQDVSKFSDYVILLMHFSPLLENSLSEFSWWISRAVEKNPPTLIIHGHVHDSIRNELKVGSTIIRNVALPATHSVTEFCF